jgi:two-component system chemotaxis response regulator CheY
MSEAKVLIVDDSKTSRKLMRTILESNGFEVIDEASNGEEAWIKYKELHPDLVTMDITMPKMDGVEALSLIKKENPDARIVMISASGQREKMVDALKRGADDFVTKPFEEEKIISTIKEVLKH